jgi:hypothetical protein
MKSTEEEGRNFKVSIESRYMDTEGPDLCERGMGTAICQLGDAGVRRAYWDLELSI